MTSHNHHLRKHALPSVDELRAVLTYDPETGQVAGRFVGMQRGYAMVCWSRRPSRWLRRARVAWAVANGYWPDTVEHLNGVRDDDRIANLADVSMSENNALKSLRRGPKGPIYRRPAGPRWPSGLWLFSRKSNGQRLDFARRDFCAVWHECQRRGLVLKACRAGSA